MNDDLRISDIQQYSPKQYLRFPIAEIFYTS